MGSPFLNTIQQRSRQAVRFLIVAAGCSLAFSTTSWSQVETGAVAKPLKTAPLTPIEPISAEKNLETKATAPEKEETGVRLTKPFAEASDEKEAPKDDPKVETSARKKPEKAEAKPAEIPKPEEPKLTASLDTRSEARTFTLAVPAPRGQILDCKGRPLAQNKVAYYAAINFPYLEDASDSEILRYAGERIVHTNQLLGANWDLGRDTVLKHYQNRRWLPLIYSDVLTTDEVAEIENNGMKGLILQPVYLRHYPNGAFLSHVLGYVGKRPPLAVGPIGRDEPLWGEGKGAEGLEEQFDRYLKGEPGKVNMLFEADGTKVREDIVSRPKPGQNLITSIDAEMQRIAEQLLAEQTKSGAFVIMDVRTGDIMAMASWPQFNPNDFIPKISTEAYARLDGDPAKPLFPRAYRGSYPPASTFKVPVALAALESRTITESSLYNCPTKWYIGDIIKHNWNKDPEGSMNVVGALARSCNTWFYQVGTRTGTDPVTSLARRLGLGEKTGLPLRAEGAGFIPTDRWWKKTYGYFMSDGDLANICIGQGSVETTPLQVARMMAAIANRQHVVKPRLVKQIQDYNHNIVANFPVEHRNELNIDPYYLDVVTEGMKEVVNSGRGTGKKAAHDVIVVAGKTGTGQWKPALEQNLAWFAGFAPADSPVYSFAVIYEGTPGEKVGGGSKCAPIIGDFFAQYLEDEKNLMTLQEASEAVEIEIAKNEPTRARPVAPSSIFKNGEPDEPEAVEAPASRPQPTENRGALSRFFDKFRRR